MKQVHAGMILVLMILLCAGLFSQAQQTVATDTNVTVPPLVNFSGVLTDLNAKPLTGVVGVTFLLYKDSQGGAPLWMETQNVQPDKTGHYTVMLGSTSSQGLPADIFVAGEAHWLGVQVQGQDEQPRVLLVSAPYALKAGDAETIGGLPPSAFVLAAPPNSAAPTASVTNSASSLSASPATSSDVTTTGGTVNAVPLFTTATNIQNSAISQTGSGATAKIGINTTMPASTLDIKGGSTVRGTLSLPSTGAATATKGANSQAQTLTASVFNSSTSTAVNQTFQWQAEPVGNDTSTATGSLNLLYGSGTAKPSETGLHIASNGQIAFAAGQTFPGTGNGTVTSVASGRGLTGGPITTNGTLAIDATVVPQLNTANTFAGTQTINNNVVISATNAGSDALDASTNSSSAHGIRGTVTATTGTTAGVRGGTSSLTGYGVYGSGGIGVEGVSTVLALYGVEGQSPNVGVHGAADGVSVTGARNGGLAGVWGDTAGTADGYSGVSGTADDNNAGYFINNSGSDTDPGGATIFAENNSSTSGAWILFNQRTLKNPACTIDTDGNLTCAGKVTGVVAAGARKVSLHAVQSPENWFEDFGSATLANGAATVALDPTFASTVNTTTDYHVFLTPRGECEGLYVANLTPAGFEVRELHHGSSTIAFDYRMVAKRAGYEKDRLEDVTDKYQQMQKQQQLRRERLAQRRAVRPAEPAPLQANARPK